MQTSLQRQPSVAEPAKGGWRFIVWLPDPAWWSRVTMNSQVRDIECSASEAPPASAQSTCLSGPSSRAHTQRSRLVVCPAPYQPSKWRVGRE